MIKPDERELLGILQADGFKSDGGKHTGKFPRYLKPEEMHPKRLWDVLYKWERKGWYSYGVSIDLGWLTEKGQAIRIDERGYVINAEGPSKESTAEGPSAGT